MSTKQQGRWIRGIAAAAALALCAESARAMKLYRDNETGEVYGTPGENREEYKPFGLDMNFQFFLECRNELAARNQPAGTVNATKLTATRPYDAFAATRTIMDIRKSFSPTSRARLVLDNRGATTGGYNVYVRHALGEIDFPSLSSTFAFGEIPLPVVPYDDGFWGYRVQGTSFLEREGIFTSGDWGLGWSTKFQSLPLEWATTFTNGEGRTTAEANSGKSIESRLTWTVPFVNGLAVSAAGSYTYGGNFVNNPNTGVGVTQSRVIGGLYYKKPFWRIGGSYIWTEDQANNYANAALLLNNGSGNMNRQSIPVAGFTDNTIHGRGASVMGVVDFAGTDWSLLGRVDWFDPWTAYRDNEHTRWIAGPAYQYNENIKFLLTYEELDFKTGAKNASGNLTGQAFDQSRILLQSEIKF